MPQAFDSIQQATFNSLISTYQKKYGKAPSEAARKELEAQSFAVATAEYKKKYGKSPTEDFINSIQLHEVGSIEVTESKGSDDLIIRGTMAKVGISGNGRKYTAEELRAAAHSWTGKSIIKDHKDVVDNIVGEVLKSYFDETTQSVKFEARIDKKEPIADKIRRGYVKSLSIGAGVKSLEKAMEEGEEIVIPRGLKGQELSLVVVPGIEAAQIASVAEKLDMMRRGESMADETNTAPAFVTKEDLASLKSEILSAVTEAVKPKVEEKKTEEKKDDITEKLQAEIKALKERVDTKEVKETPQPKGKVQKLTEADLKNSEQYVAERVGKGYWEITVNDAGRNKWSSSDTLARLAGR